MKTLTLEIAAFDRKKPDAVAEVLTIKNLPVSRDILAGIGQSFVVPRKALQHGARDIDHAASASAANGDNTGANPASGSDDLVKLQILYDDQQVSLDSDAANHGELKVERHSKTEQNANEGQKVKFVISNTNSDTVGVVLAIDGKSTLFADDLTKKNPRRLHQVDPWGRPDVHDRGVLHERRRHEGQPLQIAFRRRLGQG